MADTNIKRLMVPPSKVFYDTQTKSTRAYFSSTEANWTNLNNFIPVVVHRFFNKLCSFLLTFKNLFETKSGKHFLQQNTLKWSLKGLYNFTKSHKKPERFDNFPRGAIIKELPGWCKTLIVGKGLNLFSCKRSMVPPASKQSLLYVTQTKSTHTHFSSTEANWTNLNTFIPVPFRSTLV